MEPPQPLRPWRRGVLHWGRDLAHQSGHRLAAAGDHHLVAHLNHIQKGG